MRPPIMLNRVDLPQPDGPITARNSPGATVNDMRSTATSGPSGVSKRFDTSSTTRIGSAAATAGSRRAGDVAAVIIVRPTSAPRALRAPSPRKPGLARVSHNRAQVGQARLAVGEGWGGG